MSQSTNGRYFAADEAKITTNVLLSKASEWNDNIKSSGYLEKLRSMWSAYHGAYYSDVGDGHQVSFSGEQGELTNLPVNHLRNIGQHILVMTTSNRPSMEARATNTDYKSLVQTQLANGILDYYMREKHLETYLKKAVEYAVVMGSGFIKMEWNSNLGEIYDYNEETQTEIREGDIEFTNLSPFDVVFDGSREDQKHDWVLIRSYKNKYDLAVKYPEHAEKIKGLETKSDIDKAKGKLTYNVDSTDLVEIYEFYHIRTESMSNGRYMLFLRDDIVLQDVPMPYRVLPVFRISPSDILGTPFGYTPLFDLLPLQESINSLYSTILSNQSAFGVQNIWVKTGNDVSVDSLSGGLNIVQSMEEPKPLNLTHTPKEIFEFLKMLEQTMETISGVNSVARGNPEASLRSGTALALVQSMALQFMSGLQQSYVQLIEDVGSGIIKVLQDYAHAPRLIAIAGKSNRTFMKEFSGEDISSISRVIVDVGNPLARTIAGRVQLAEQMLQYQVIKNPAQIINLINTGKLEVMSEDLQTELMLIRAENERMVDGETPPVTMIDDHKQHIMEHRAVLADPDLRKNPELVGRVLGHIQEHIYQLKTGDPELLMLMGQQPLQQMMPPEMSGGSPSGPGGGSPSDVMQSPQGQSGMNEAGEVLQGPGIPEGIKLPQPSKPPEPFQNNPVLLNQMPQ